MESKSTFDMYKFNRLPRTLIDKNITQKDEIEQNLLESLPFVFKPNRVLALHPKYGDADGGMPYKDKRMRWTIKLKIPSAFTEFKDEIYVVVINREGWLSVWHYESDTNTKHSGLFQIPIKSKQTQITDNYGNSLASALAEQNFLYLSAYQLSTEDLSRRSPYHFNLSRLTQQVDEDGLITIKLITDEYEHIVKFDLGNYCYHCNNHQLLYSHTINDVDGNDPKIRQIGGWAGGESFFWQDDSPPCLKAGNYHQPKKVIFPSNSKISRFWAVIEQEVNGETVRVFGGEGRQLWWYDNQGYKQLNDPKNPVIQGDIRSITLLPADKCGQEYPIIIAGSDDLYLYILTHKGKELQRVNMGGSVDGLLFLKAEEKQWFDLVVLVRHTGLMCVRLFFDEFRLKGEIVIHKNSWFERVASKLDEKYSLLSEYLADEQIIKQVAAVTYLTNELTQEKLESFKEKDVLSQLNSHTKIYWQHRITQQLLDITSNLNNVTFQKYKKEETEIQKILLLELLFYMANSDYYSRVLIRSMKGWLLSLKLSEKLPKKNVNKIVEKIPDAKRLLQKLSLCIAKNSKDVEAIGTFVSAWEFLKYKQSFDEIIVTPTDRPNRVEGINIVCDKKKNSEKELVFTNIHSRYGHSKLSAFSTAASNRGIRNLYQGDDNWQKQIGKSSINIRQLIPIDSENVIVLADSCVGIANKYLKAIDWQIDIKDITLWSMTYYPDYNQDQDGLLAIGGEWHKNLDAIFTYRFDNKNHAHKKFHRVNNKLYLPSNWSSRTRFSQLQWDEKGNLWAVTGDRGELFCWENALAHIQDINSGSITAKHLASCGHTQHALVVTENHVLTGGDTGVLRAFNHSGQLLWANVYESSIRAITSTLLNSESDQKLCAAFATVTENGQLILCNENGIQQGYFRTSGHHHVNNMVSKIVGASKTQHHLIGMYSGETRLVEEVPQNWHPRDYLNVELYKPWEDITSSIQKVAENKKLCQQWCGLDDIEIAIKEPYRAIWAARQLIEKYRDYTNVIKLLKNERIKQRFDPVVKELQIGLLGLLGESLKELPDEFHKDIIELCRASRYYGFTKFILRVPKLDSNNNKQMELLGTLSNIAHKKILTGDVSVTAAILQRLRLQEKSGKPEDDLQYLLYRAIREIKVFERQVHIGYIESLFALLFKQADLDKKGILGVFFQIEHKYPRLIKLFKKRKETVNKFVTWLNLYSQTLFNEPDFLLWVNLAPELLKHQVNKQVIKNILKDPKIGREADRKLLQSYLNLFPNSNICGTHLDKDWSQYLELVKALRTGSSQINNHTISSEDAAQWFETHENLLNKDKIQPLLRSFEKLLFNEWLSELTQLRHVLVLPKPYSLIHEQSTISLSNEFKEVFQRFFQVMYEIGYEQDGIFCQAHHVLGCSGYLEPVVSLRGHQHSKQVKTHQESLLAELKIFATDEKLPNDADLVYKQCEKKPFLIIPLLGINPLWNESNNYLFNQADIPRDKYLATFVFIFSSTKDILEEQPDSRKTLLTILRQINQYITIERTKNQNKQYEILSRLEHHYFHNNHYDEQGLFLAAKDLTSASGGLLAMENTATNWLDVRISRGTENTYLTHTQFDTRDNQNPVTRCWSDSKLLSIPKLAQNNLYKKFYQLIDIDEDNLEPNTTNIKKWLDKSVDGSMLIAPIFKGSTNNKLVKVGILLLSSHKPKFFTTEKVAIVEQLLQKIHWVLETIKLREQQEYMQGLFLHEIRSVVIPIAQNVDFMSKSPQDKMPEQLMNVKRYADKAKDLVENYLSITGSFVDKNSTFKDTYRTISRFLDLNKTRIELSQQKVTIKTPNHKLWHDAHLVGIKSVYERVVRVLLDNALKYGGNHADINITVNKVGKMWQLTITNPGYMTKEENQLKFEAFKFSLDREPNKAPTGTHLGLAASKRVVEAYDGQLLVENYSEYGEKRVIATLLWPLALESEQGEHHE